MQSALARIKEYQSGSVQQVVDALVEESIRITKSDIGYFAILNAGGDKLTMLGWSKSAMEACKAMNKPIVYEIVHTGLWGDCVRQSGPVITNDYLNSTSPTKKGYPEGHVQVVRHLNVPIIELDRMRGILGVGNKPTDYTEADADLLQRFANAAWLSVNAVLKI